MSDEKPNADPSGPPEKPLGQPDEPPTQPLGQPAEPTPVPPPAAPDPAFAPSPPPPPPPPRPKRTSEQIRADIDSQRAELGQSVDQLRDRVTELTDWRGQIRKHRKQIIIGAVATGFIVGGLAALRRR